MDKDTSLLLTHHIKPDYGFYIQNDDRLYVAAYSSVSSLVVRFSGYFLSHNGEVRQYAVDVAPTNNRAGTSALQSVGEGIILSCIAHLLTGNANRGQCYVRARIQRGTGATIVPIVQLLGGYLSDEFSPSFPYGKIEGPLEGPGYLRGVIGTDVAAGAEVAETVPTGARWRVTSLTVLLVTSADVANRYVELDFKHGGEFIGGMISTQVQVASKAYVYTFAAHLDRAFVADNDLIQLPIPVITLAAGDVITIWSPGLVAADNFNAPVMYLEEWMEA